MSSRAPRGPYDRTTLRSPPRLVLVNTGHGKGKPTAAFGTLLRRRGRDWPTAIVDGARHWLELDAPSQAHPRHTDRSPTRAEGCVRADGRVLGTSVHGILDQDSLRHNLLRDVAAHRGRDFSPSPVGYAEALDSHMERLADWIESHVDLPHLLELAGTATPVDQEPGW